MEFRVIYIYTQVDLSLAYTMHAQHVIVDGEASDFVRVIMYGVSQGTVLGPLMFLLYVNNISENLTSHVRLFAND